MVRRRSGCSFGSPIVPQIERTAHLAAPRLGVIDALTRYTIYTNIHEYQCTNLPPGNIMIEIDRVQTGIRIEKRLLKVLKALAELKDLSLGDLLEGIVLHAFEGKTAFSKETLAQIAELRKIYHLSLRAGDSHKLKDKPA
jgi:hypothetical protein